MMPFAWWVVWSLLVAPVPGKPPVAAGKAVPKPVPSLSLRVLSDRPLPEALRKAVDVRWASDRSVYLGLLQNGTVEASVEPGPPAVLRKVIPGNSEPGGFWGSSRVGVSSKFLVAAGPMFSLTWRTLKEPVRKEEAFDFIEDIDVGGDRLLVIGARRDDHGNFAPDGGIVWLGSLSKNLTDLKPLLYDTSGAGAAHLNACGTFEMGAVRFLADGSLFVVPGVQAGAHLYDAGAKLVRTWDTVALGLDSDCGRLGTKEIAQLQFYEKRVAWLNQRRILDDLLPLPQGPGLLVRSVSGGRVYWVLKVLQKDGATVNSYPVPVPELNERSRIRGDVRGNKIVLLVATLDKTGMKQETPRLVIAEISAAGPREGRL